MDRYLRPPRLAFVPAALAVAIAACGTGSPGATTAGTQGPQTAGATSGTLPTTGPVTTQAGSGGGLTEADDFCLNTPDEVTAALGVGTVTAAGMANPGLGGGCLYSDSTGAVVYAISVVVGSNAVATFESYKSGAGAEEVPGIGDGAIYLPLNELWGIAFIKGDVLASMSPTPTLAINDDEAALRAALAALAGQAAGRA
jgi:hypothetical protein